MAHIEQLHVHNYTFMFHREQWTLTITAKFDGMTCNFVGVADLHNSYLVQNAVSITTNNVCISESR